MQRDYNFYGIGSTQDSRLMWRFSAASAGWLLYHQLPTLPWYFGTLPYSRTHYCEADIASDFFGYLVFTVLVFYKKKVTNS